LNPIRYVPHGLHNAAVLCDVVKKFEMVDVHAFLNRPAILGHSPNPIKPKTDGSHSLSLGLFSFFTF
jgi:hypothetical protein